MTLAAASDNFNRTPFLDGASFHRHSADAAQYCDVLAKENLDLIKPAEDRSSEHRGTVAGLLCHER